MPSQFGTDLQNRLDHIGHASSRVSELTDVILEAGVAMRASDAHFEPAAAGLVIRLRIDGVLLDAARLPRELANNFVARLKVLSQLLTYRIDIPQEGRVPGAVERYGVDIRVSCFPTVFGEKAVVRMFHTQLELRQLHGLGLPPSIAEPLAALLGQSSGAILLTGPSGSGKTTTIYACLQHIISISNGMRHVVTIEDPVEQIVAGASQSQVQPGGEFDFRRGLRSLLRQDPEVIMVGEVRDAETAAIAIEAALTGHLLISTLHAGSASGVISRLLDMRIEPYLLTSGLNGVLNQRLVRKLCPNCRRIDPIHPESWMPVGCGSCAGTGYQGRMLLAELMELNSSVRQAVLRRADTSEIQTLRGQSIWTTARDAINRGQTSRAEVERVLGTEPAPDSPA